MFGSKEQPAKPATSIATQDVTYGEELVIQLRKDLVKALQESGKTLSMLYGQQATAHEFFNMATRLAKKLPPEEPK